MVRGKTTFLCKECGKLFKDHDIEYHAMFYSCPMKCPKCGSNHTLPLAHLPMILTYRQIWKNMDERPND